MKKTFPALSLCLVLISTPVILHAEGDEQAGKDKAASCVGCHGEDGNSATPIFPKLAGQHASYLIKQLQEFKTGTRKNAMMSAMVGGLSEQDMADIATYYAKHKTSANDAALSDDDDDADSKTSPADKQAAIDALSAKGHQLYRNGDLAREVSACIACHGSHAEGNKPAAFPVLKAQHADYLIKTLTDFKTGARTANPENPMVMIAKKMSDEEIKAVSYYLAYLNLPAE